MYLVTGANGFIGKHLLDAFTASNIPFRATTRCQSAGFFTIKTIDGSTDWTDALQGISTIVHLAAVNENVMLGATASLHEYNRVNVAGTLRLAQQAALTGVKRFIFLSSAKVNGEISPPGKPFSSTDAPNPQTAYAISKHTAEMKLREFAERCDMEVVVIRPPLVYGTGAKGSFNSLVNLVSSGVPLPFRAIENRRSMLHVLNICDLILAIGESKINAPYRTVMASDGFTTSTSELIAMIAVDLGRRDPSFRFPNEWIRLLCKIFRKEKFAMRILDNLEVIDTEVKQFDWTPRISPRDGMQMTIRNVTEAS